MAVLFIGVAGSNFGVIIPGIPPAPKSDIPDEAVILPLTLELLAVLKPPKAAAVKVDEANGVSLSKKDGAKRFLVDFLTAEELLGAAARMLLFFLFLVALETLFLAPAPAFTVVLTSFESDRGCHFG
jgi:hypothetical protein